MNGPWYYSHANATHGPFSMEEIKERVARKMLLENDWVWQGAGDVQLQAASMFDFSPQPVAPAVPDWLADVVEVEKKVLPAPASGVKETPEWLEDLRLWVALEQYEPGWDTFNKRGPGSTPTQGVPDWLTGWSVPAEPKKPAAAPPPSPAIPVRVSPPPPVAPPLATPVAKPTAPPSPVAPPLATPVAPTPPAPQPAPAPREKTAAELMLEVSGFDPETGQILDAEKFRQWKQQQSRSGSASQPGVSNASLFEVFRKGRTAIEAWVDDPKNRLCVMHAELDEIRRNADLQAILAAYANYGQALQDKLMRHLEFMVENRRKYYRALEQR